MATLQYPADLDHSHFNKPEQIAYPESAESHEVVLHAPITAGPGSNERVSVIQVQLPKPPGVSRVSLVADGRYSQSFNNGYGPGYKPEKLAIDQEKRFCFAPGADKPRIAWKYRQKSMLKSFTLELFSIKDKGTPLWSKAFTDPAVFDTDPVDGGSAMLDLEGIERVSFHGSLDWEEHVTLDPGFTFPGEDAPAFPDGVVNVANAPYLLKMTVTPKEGGTEALDAFPTVAWTYFDVLVHDIELIWGKDVQDKLGFEPEDVMPDTCEDPLIVDDERKQEIPALEKDVLRRLKNMQEGRPDVYKVMLHANINPLSTNKAYLVTEKVVSDFDSDQHATATLSLKEKVYKDATFKAGTVIATRKGEQAYQLDTDLTFNAGTTGPVNARVTLNAEKSEEAQDKSLSSPEVAVDDEPGSFFKAYEKAWGHGPRIPVFARVRIRRANGHPAQDEEVAKKALGPAEFYWDWDDGPGTVKEKIERWVDPNQPGARALTYRYLDEAMKARTLGPDYPLGVTNCPVKYGGKLGDAEAPIFPPQDGTGSFPYVVTAPDDTANRRWAALSRAGTGDKAGTTGVFFQPSRMVGDRYRLFVYLVQRDASGNNLLDIDERVEAGESGALDPSKGVEPLNDGSCKPYTLHAQVEAQKTRRVPYAVSDVFEVCRRVDVVYFTYPDQAPGSENIDQVSAHYRRATGTLLNVDKKQGIPATFTTKKYIEEVYDDKVYYQAQNPEQQFYLFHAFFMPLEVAKGPEFVHTRSFDEYKQAAKQAFKDKKVVALEVDDELESKIGYEVKGSTKGWVVSTCRDNGGKKGAERHIAYVLLKEAGAFSKGEMLQYRPGTTWFDLCKVVNVLRIVR